MTIETEKKNIAILGGGSFGTTIANICANNGHNTKIWMRNSSQVSEINQLHTNKQYLGKTKINPSITATNDIIESTVNADFIYISIPSTAFRSVVKKLKPLHNKTLISTTKGIEAKTFFLMTEIIKEELPTFETGALSGPNISKEIIQGVITSTVIASDNQKICQSVQNMLQSDSFRVYNSNDPYGVQLGGALKNVYAIAAGIASSLNMGDNSRSMLITRSLAEMTRFAVSKGANPITFLGLAGVGDLIVTCISPLSRNFQLGQFIGRGMSVDDAVKKLGQVAEGVNTLKLLKTKTIEEDIYMPIANGLYKIIFEKHCIHKTIRNSMLAEQKKDVDFIS